MYRIKNSVRFCPIYEISKSKFRVKIDHRENFFLTLYRHSEKTYLVIVHVSGLKTSLDYPEHFLKRVL